MRLKPTKLIVHKLGPFDHLELNWDNKDSRRTLIVAENGLGKTTLVAALAACLSFGNEHAFPLKHLERFAQDETAYSYLELDLEGETGWVFYRVKKPSTLPPVYQDPTLKIGTTSFEGIQKWIYKEFIHSQDNISKFINTKDYYNIFEIPDEPSNRNAFFLENLTSIANDTYYFPIEFLNAAYGTSRNIHQTSIKQHISTRDGNSDNLNPFVSIESGNLLQFVANQYINHALALVDDNIQEATAYKQVIDRITDALSEELQVSVQFSLKRNPFELELTIDGVPISVNQLSDGTRSFMSWILDYLMRASAVEWENPTDSVNPSGIVVVDEIDSHLHPEWQRRIMSVVSKLLPNVYLIATTHSPFVLASAEDTQIFRLYRDEQGQIAVQSDFGDLYDYPADLVLEKAFLNSLYPPEIERKMNRLSELVGQMTFGKLSEVEQEEHDELFKELATVNPWLNNLLNLAQTTK
ncbi:ATP-binding protein [Anaerolineales bacterium HSG24]|nr:ATP-binding protein [Anaerolineales bacterium HSG24]